MQHSLTMQDLISISKAEELILASCWRAGSEQISIQEAHHRILQESIIADRPSPPFDRVMMDGIAISYSNFSSSPIPIVGIQAAGSPQLTLKNQEGAIEVMTGAPLPKLTDCVIPVEQYSVKNGNAHFLPDTEITNGQHIHTQGSDNAEGYCVLAKGIKLQAPELGIAASVGAINLKVAAIPEVAIITTGDEVIPPESSPLAHQIRQSHPTVLSCLLQSNKLSKVSHSYIEDNTDKLTEKINDTIKSHDIIILTGGISKGKYDFVAPCLTYILGSPLFHGVKQRPGKPFAYWRKGSKQVFALPGNPVSVLATATRYLLPALRQFIGAPLGHTSLPLSTDFTWNFPFPGLLPCQINAGALIPQPTTNSGDYLSLSGVNGFAQIEVGNHNKGKHLKFYPF